MRPPQSWHNARATAIIAAVTVGAFLILSATGLRGWAVGFGAFIPLDHAVDFSWPRAPFLLTPLTATLLHAGALHLIFNMLMHLFCGRAVEGVMGPRNLVILYVLGAYVAAGAHFLVNPQDLTPMVGASGAISAIIGAYAMLFGKNRVKVANSTLALWLNALWLMAAWVGMQVLIATAFSAGGIGVAAAAHVGGFLVGLALARPLLLWRYRGA